MGAFRFAHQLLRGGSVSGTSPDPTFLASWICDGVPGTPYQKTGDVVLGVAPATAMTMDVFALVNHTVQVNTLLGGSVSGTIPPGSLDEEGIRLNPFVILDPTLVTLDVNVVITSNGDPVIIGEFYGGLSVSLDPYQLDFDPGEPFAWEGEFASIAPYDSGLSHPRRLTGDVILDDAGFAQIRAWYRATHRGSRPSLVIPDDEVQDAWCAVFRYRERYAEGLHFVTLDVMELPRTRW